MHVKLHTVRAQPNFLPACQWLGTVTTDAGNQGALMELDGRYFIVRKGNAEPLDALAVAQAIAADMTRTPGRPSLHGRPMRRCLATLTDEHADKARAIGGGNLSLGIRRALDNYGSDER